MKDGYRVVDADAHVIEPGDLWERYIAPEYRDRAPRHLNLAFSVVTDGVSINTPDRWDPAATPEQLAHRDERIQATFAESARRATMSIIRPPRAEDRMRIEGRPGGRIAASSCRTSMAT